MRQKTQDEEYICAREEMRGDKGERSLVCLYGSYFGVQMGPQKLEMVPQETGQDGNAIGELPADKAVLELWSEGVDDQ